MSPIKKHPIIAWFCDNTVVANILMLIILGMGISTAISVRKEAFPSFDAESVTVSVPFRGGTPEDVERGVAIKIEESLQGIKGIDHISSTSTESNAKVTINAIEDYSITKLLDDVKIQVDAISSFPEQAEKPIITENQRSHDVLRVNLYGDVAESVLKEAARTLRDDLLKLENITLVETSGARDYEVSVEVSENQLRAYNLTFNEVADAISNNSIDLSGGVVRSDSGDISVRTRDQAYVAADFAKIPLRTEADGTRILLGDIAEIRDGFVDQEYLSRFNGQPSVGLSITSEGDNDIIKAADEATQFVASYAEVYGLPEGVQISSWQDGSESIRSRLKLLIDNGILGVLLVLISLALFLNLRLAFWVALGIPISIAGALAAFPFPLIDISLNQLTAFAFIIVLGIIVDDAIVIGESIYSTKEEDEAKGEHHKNDLHSTVRGVSKVVTPATFGVLTTIAAFYPLTQVSGRMGNVFGQIATGVILCLIFSLVESKLILPSHLNHIRIKHEPKNFISRRWARFQEAIARGLKYFVQRLYQPALRAMIPYRYVTLAAFIAVLILVIGLLPSGKLRFVFFPDIYRDSISANLELEQGLPVDYLHENANMIADALQQTIRELESKSGETLLRHISVNASSNTAASIAAELTTSETRTITTGDIVKAWRSKIPPISGAKALTISGTRGPGQGLEIQLASQSLDDLQAAAEAMKAKVATYPGIHDIQDTFDSGRPEIQVQLTPAGQAAGYNKQLLANNVRSAFYGTEAQRVQRGRDEVKVMVRYPIEERSQLETLRDMRIRTDDGSAVPFSVVADTQYGDSLASIERFDNNRIVSVKADIDKAVTSSEEVLALLSEDYFPTFLAEHPNVSINLYGEAEQRAKSVQSLLRGFGFSILMIYILIAVPLKSYTKPLFIMSVIPFGIIGALLGHFLIGIPISILSVFGILALSGIVVNDSLVLMSRLDDLGIEAPDTPLAERIIRAGGERFRAILLTTLTTFVGLIPLLAETSTQAQFLKPMAVSVGFGVVFATGITLVLLPIMILIANDLRSGLSHSCSHWRGMIFGRK
ncbi:efflux RND transporter permease subunit [Coraliomargarita sp. SDUM461004]|uniref:Efflux RND transporter permease subunit n=1 Tax=Thalassobacterium sedimentorum TaxID=3041258 RepID=A0ABU1AKS4_9BACT|nr:efflux RND transporter permease subunit [Coraliomargarita sp. SDUM461004]MDQ8195405.1 efflux RND transporter permease subunit [Coraliomargarita sp. SDUM461004]